MIYSLTAGTRCWRWFWSDSGQVWVYESVTTTKDVIYTDDERYSPVLWESVFREHPVETKLRRFIEDHESLRDGGFEVFVLPTIAYPYRLIVVPFHAVKHA